MTAIADALFRFELHRQVLPARARRAPHPRARVVAGVWEWLPFDATVEHALEQAFLRLGPKVYLRAGDAIHLATASLHGLKEIHSHDKHVLAAASGFGLRGGDVLRT